MPSISKDCIDAFLPLTFGASETGFQRLCAASLSKNGQLSTPIVCDGRGKKTE